MPGLKLNRTFRIGRYEVQAILGQGAMATVYKALDPLIERIVAIKTVPIARLKEEGPEFEARFLREAQSAGRLSHPHIVTIYDVGETEDVAYIAMEYLDGPTLREIMDRGPMPLDLALDTARQMAEALAFAHRHGVIHRDVKPANVVVTGQRGMVKLTDFGIAHLASSERTQSGLMLGSPRYMSPEQAMGREIDGRSDIFSLGALLYEMLSGEYAFDGDSLPSILYHVVNENPPALSRQRAAVTPELERLVARMLAKNPADRPDAREVVEALQHQAQPALPAARKARFPRALVALAFATPLLVFLLIGLGIIVISYFVTPRPAARPPAAPPPAPVPAARDTQDAETPARAAAPPASHAPATAKAPKKAPASAKPRTAAGDDPFLESLKQKEVELRIKRTELLLKYTEQHPDVVLIDRQLEQLEAERRRYLRHAR